MPPDFLWPFKRKALTATPAVVDGIRNNWTPWPLLGGGSRQRIMEAFSTAQSANYAWMYTNSPAVRTVVDVVARNVSQLDLRLYEEVDEAERQPRPEHPAALSMRYPSNTVPADQFVRSLVKDYLVFNNAYALMFPAADNQIVFKWIPAHLVQVLGADFFDPEIFRVHNQFQGIYVDYPPENILHWRGENPHDPRIGLSHLETLRGVIAEDAALQASIVELANAGLTEPVWVYRPLDAPQWGNEDRKWFEEDLNNRIRRKNKTPVVLEEGMEMRSFGVSPREVQMAETRKWALARVAAEYGVPAGMVGLDDNLEEARSQFYADTLPPLCEEFTRMLNHHVLVRVYDWTDGCFEFNLDEKFMGENRWKALVSATGRPIFTTNEGRAKVNAPPIDGGDELVTPANVIVGDNPKPSVDVMPIQDPNRPSQDGDARDEEQTPSPARNRSLDGDAKADTPKPLRALESLSDGTPDESERVPQLIERRSSDLERQIRYVDEVERSLKRYYGRQLREFQKKARTKFDTDRWNRELGDRLDELMHGIVDRETREYMLKLASGDDFDMSQVQNYLTATAKGVAEAINQATQEDINEFGVEAALERAQNERAQVAASSIGARSAIFARHEAAKQAPGYEQRQKTYVAHTNRHAAQDGVTIPIGADWPGGFAPGSPPNCRCTMTIT